MFKHKTVNKITTFLSLIALIVSALFCVFAFNRAPASADGENTVSFTTKIYETQDSGIVYAELLVRGKEGQKVGVTYHTEGETAIEGIDYNAVANTVYLTITYTGTVRYSIAIKTLNNSSTREKLRVFNDKETFGRYFYIVIDRAENATVVDDRCKCYLPYDHKTEATVGIMQNGAEAAYLNSYATMQEIYNGGKGNLDGKSTWKSWNNGVSFVNNTTSAWLNTFINTGFANAYASYMIKTVDTADWHSSTDIHLVAGNHQFYEKYDGVEEGIPGTYLYITVNPHKGKIAGKINGRSMYLTCIGKNPYKEDEDLIDVTRKEMSTDNKRVYWIQDQDAWFANKNSLVDSVFFKIEPHKGVVNSYLAIKNNNREFDVEIKNLWFFLSLIDDTCPIVTGQYVDDSRIESEGKLRFYVRFNEPVFSSKQKPLEVKLNNGTTPYYAEYVGGNYSDTLIYELDMPGTEVSAANYQLPTDDIGDMAYNLDAYKKIQNNKVQNTDQVRVFKFINGKINNVKPHITVDKVNSLKPKNNYNLLLTLNDNGSIPLNKGTFYYEWSKSETKSNANDTASYSNVRKVTEEEMGSISVTLSRNLSEGIDSGMYYLHVLATGNYGTKSTASFGPYFLDGDPPELVNNPLPQNDLRTKTFEFVNRKTTNAAIYKIDIVAKWKDDDGADNTAKFNLMDASSKNSLLRVLPDYTYQYVSNINDELDENGDGSPDIALDEFILGIMGDKPRLNVQIAFEAEDTAGNRGTSNFISVTYDKRDSFKVESAFPTGEGYVPLTDIELPYPAFDISSVNRNGEGIKITVSEEDRSQIVDGSTALRVIVNDEDVYEALPTDKYTVAIKDLPAGFFRLVANIYGSIDETEVDLVANPVCFYLSDGMNDATLNNERAHGNIVLINKVFEIEDARYYYLDSEDKVSSHLYGAVYNADLNKYESGSSLPAFSSVTEAKKYVRFMEYQDLHLVKLTANMASMLNSSAGSTTYVKAAGETRTAQEGQIWVRYKKNTWTDSSNAYGWGYYFYASSGSESDGVDLSRLSSNLMDAINTVVNRIVSVGKTVYLVEESGLWARTGAPYLAASQMHVETEIATATKTGDAFANAPEYEGDGELYKSTVNIDGKSYPLATNMPLRVEEGTQLFYRYYESSTWRPIVADDGQTLSEILNDNASGIYVIREYGPRGISEFSVYFDRTKPVLKMTINGEQYELDGTAINFSGTSASIDALVGETDEYGYVAIYSYPAKRLQAVFYANEIRGYDLGSSNYYIQVGDRSGNIVTYTILLSDSSLEVSVTESQSQTGVIIRVSNRDDSEIYSYEVYLNEELITSEYAETKIFKDPGVYRVVVVDIYGNMVSDSFRYDFPSPRMTWYYANASGGYSRYDEERIVNMVITKDPASTRVSNVYTSARLRLVFDTTYGESEIRFEVLDIASGDYTYSAATNVLTFNTDANFRLRVWFEEYPENDHLYVCSADVEAPNFVTQFVGTTYSANVSLDDADFLEKVGEGDVISLENLSITEGESTALSFVSGEVIYGNHITITLEDSAGIRSYTVTRNGQPVSLALNSENQLVIKNYGYYEITATDMLGNVSVFSFVNVKEPVATATVDETEAGEELVYGRDSIITKTEYASVTSVLIKTANGNVTYNFDYTGRTLTYGQYVCAIDEDGVKYADLIMTKGFSMDFTSENIRENRWYDVLANSEYTISVMYDSEGYLSYKVACVEKEIEVQTLVYVGNNKYPSLFLSRLSKEVPTLLLLTNGQEAEIVENLDYVYIAGTLTVGELSENVTELKIGYSESPDVTELITVYKDGEYLADFSGTEDGYYKLVVTNKFGSQTVYVVNKIQAFTSVVNVTYLDGKTVRYTGNPGAIRSNSLIELGVFSKSVRFEVNGDFYDGLLEGGMTVLQLNRQGEYDVRIVATNGVFEEFRFEIATDSRFTFDEEWLSGYNEKALLLRQGYTNSPLSVLLGDNVEYVDFVFDGETTVLYDNVSETPVKDAELLSGAIGKNGNGVYTVNFRNKYGDLASKEIHYSTQSSLNVSRRTVSNSTEWKRFTDEELRNGCYSNYVLRFETVSSNYEFRINGDSVSLETPRTLEFTNTSGNGSFEYDVYFLDEYGNEMAFKAVLLRTDVRIETPDMNEITVNGRTYTKDNVSITFSSDLKATVSIDDEEPTAYTSGYVFYKDGTYLFTVEDVAGNVTEYTITHKSVNHYVLEDAKTGQAVISGGVVNDSSVVFNPQDDSAVKIMVRDGEIVSSENRRTFSKTGHWELLIEDSVGNTSYAEFYVVNNSLGEFTYTAPYDFEITEIWLTDVKGNKTQIESDGKSALLDKNGDYAVAVTGVGITSSFRFTVTIDSTPPSATLVGVENNGVTARNVTIKGLKNGDNVKIYKDNVLINDIEVGQSAETPEITTGGNYRVVITNLQGVKTEYEFTRKKIANTATSIFLIVIIFMFVGGITIGLLYHTRQKTDE